MLLTVLSTLRRRPRRRSTVAILAVVAALTTGLLFVGSTSTVAETRPPGRYPGLPFQPCVPTLTQPTVCDDLGQDFYDKNNWLAFGQSGVASSRHARQWARMPVSLLATNYYIDNDPRPEGPCTYDPDLPCTSILENRFTANAFFVSPPGSSSNYGSSEVITVRSLAFGAVPVTIGLQLRQLRDADDLPLPIVLRTRTITEYRQYPDDPTFFDGVLHTTSLPTTISQNFTLAVTSLTVDGVKKDVAGCETPPTATLALKSRQASEEGDNVVDPKVFDPSDLDEGFRQDSGGSLEGELSIPPFENCGADDIGPLLTSIVSGSDNPVTVFVGRGCPTLNLNTGVFRPPAPGEDTFSRAKFPLCPPDGTIAGLRVTPKQFPIPDRAP